MVTLLPNQCGVTMTAPVIMEGNSGQNVDYSGEKEAILNGLFKKPSIADNRG
jgi:hypothetical protein